MITGYLNGSCQAISMNDYVKYMHLNNAYSCTRVAAARGYGVAYLNGSISD